MVVAFPTDAASAATFLAAYDLSSSGVTRTAIPAVTRRTCLIETQDGAGWFVKEHDDALIREDQVYELFQQGLLPASLESCLPPRLLVTDGIRVYRGYTDCVTWYELLKGADGFRPDLAEHIGRWIGELHRRAIPPGALLQRVNQVHAVPLVRAWNNITVEAFADAPGFQFAEFLAAAQRVGANLGKLARRQVDPIVLHGDLKADNLLVGDQFQLHLVDWELCRVGDATFDLGTLVGSILAAWLELVPARPGMPLTAWFQAAPVSSARLAICLSKLVRSYEAAHRPLQEEDLNALWSYAGLFLLERGFVTNWIYGRFLLSTRAAMQLGERLLADPSLGPATFQVDFS